MGRALLFPRAGADPWIGSRSSFREVEQNLRSSNLYAILDKQRRASGSFPFFKNNYEKK